MSEAKHMPGPWEVIPFVDNRQSGSDHHTYKVTPQRGVYGSLYEADAHLIAAAPELLEALQKIDVHLSILMGNIYGSAKVDHRWDGMEDVVRGWRDEVMAAIAKAEGA